MIRIATDCGTPARTMLRMAEREQTVLSIMRKLRAERVSLRQISAVLAERGIVARSGKPLAPQVLSKLLVSDRSIDDSNQAPGAAVAA